MGGITLSIHPLFYIYGFYYALTGRIFLFVIYTVSAVIHEIGHSISASRCGYRLNKIKLMPFGAVVSGYYDDVNLIDEIKIALAGPFLNLAVGLFFIATWWIFPNLYAFTDIVVEANVSLFLLNILPAYPLDGGRVLKAFLSQSLSEKTVKRILFCSGMVLFCVMLALFGLSFKSTPNYSVLFFATFVLAGLLNRDKENKYVKILSGINERKLLYGLPVKVHALSIRTQVKRMVAVLDVNAVNEVQVLDGQRVVSRLDGEKINYIIQNYSLTDTLEKYLKSGG